jgi:hypothetical protein
MFCRVLKSISTDVSEVRAASIIRAISEPSYPFALGSLITLMMEAVHTSETSVNIYVTTRQYIPEDSTLHKLLYFHI